MRSPKKKSTPKPIVHTTTYVRVPSDVLEAIDQHAEQAERSRNFIISRILRQAVDRFIAGGAL